MKRYALAAMALGVWLTGAASAAALTYELHRPLTPPKGTTDLVMSRGAAAEELRAEAPVPLEVPTTIIVGRRVAAGGHTAPLLVPATPPEPKDIDEMSCAEWRELDMGSGHVRICE
jgi:hypothetical protein